MKRSRQGARVEHFDQTNHFPEDYVGQLADALRRHSDVLVVDPETLVSTDAAAQCPQRDVVQSLSLILLSTATAFPSSTCGDGLHQCTLRGIGVLDCSSSPAPQSGTEGVAPLIFHVVPVSIVVTPWMPQLPPRLRTLVCHRGHFASFDGCDFGQRDVGPIPEGYVPREASVLVHGLPRCCVEAVSGKFPLFCAPPLHQRDPHDGAAETRWRLRGAGDEEENTRNAAMSAQLKALAALRAGRLWSALEALLPRLSAAVELMWVVVSYPGGLPTQPTPRCCALSGGLATHPRRAVADGSAAGRDGGAVEDAGSPVSPLFVLPARFLCQQFRVCAGWLSIPPQHRKASRDAVESLCRRIEATPLRTRSGTTVTAAAVCDPVDGVQGPAITLVPAIML